MYFLSLVELNWVQGGSRDDDEGASDNDDEDSEDDDDNEDDNDNDNVGADGEGDKAVHKTPVLCTDTNALTDDEDNHEGLPIPSSDTIDLPLDVDDLARPQHPLPTKSTVFYRSSRHHHSPRHLTISFLRYPEQVMSMS